MLLQGKRHKKKALKHSDGGLNRARQSCFSCLRQSELNPTSVGGALAEVDSVWFFCFFSPPLLPPFHFLTVVQSGNPCWPPTLTETSPYQAPGRNWVLSLWLNSTACTEALERWFFKTEMMKASQAQDGSVESGALPLMSE